MTRDQVIVSYSHRDQKWLERLQNHLKPIIRTGAIEVWDDRRIKIGALWREEISAALGRARVAILLVTPDFLASDFIAEHELPLILDAARAEGVTILWVAVKDSAYRETEIARYQCANGPDRPLSRMHHAHVDEELVKICSQVKAAFIGRAP
jgi:internalin A